jgi:hypothetical protein
LNDGHSDDFFLTFGDLKMNQDDKGQPQQGGGQDNKSDQQGQQAGQKPGQQQTQQPAQKPGQGASKT